MAATTLSSGTKVVPYMPMTVQAILCPAPVLLDDFDSCLIPGDVDLWENGGFYSPGECFVGYRAMCTQTAEVSNGWPIRKGETVVRCIPLGYGCNDQTRDQKFAISNFDGTLLSAPAFEIRWRSEDLKTGTDRLPPGVLTLAPPVSSTSPAPAPGSNTGSRDATAVPSFTRDATRSEEPTPTDPPPSSGSNFVASPGSIAGIAVGSCLGFLAVISTIIFILLRKRRKYYEGPARLAEDPWRHQDAYGDSARSAIQPPVELEDKPLGPRELSAESQSGIATRSYYPETPHILVNETPAEIAGDGITAASDHGINISTGRICKEIRDRETPEQEAYPQG